MDNSGVEKDLLNENEKIILEMIEHGCEIREIAQILGISVHTVKSHISKLERQHKFD